MHKNGKNKDLNVFPPQYFSASYAREKGVKSKEESGEKGGAAVIPICLPLCCAAPCVIM